MSKRFTLNLGMRFDRYTGWIPAGGNPGTGPYAVKTSYPKRDITAFHNFVPRFSIAWDVFGNTKTALKASWGRFSENVGTGFVSNLNPVAVRSFRYIWNGTLPITPAYVASLPPSALQNVSGQNTPPAVDPNLKNALSQQYTAGIEHELFPNFGVAANFVRSFGYNKWGTIDRAYPTSQSVPLVGIDPGKDGIVDLATDQRVTIYERPGGTARPSDNLLTNFPGGDHYVAYDIRATKRMSDKWQMIGSWEWDKVNLAPPNVTDPNVLVWGGTGNENSNTNAHYTTNVFKILGSYDLPKGIGFSSRF